MVWCVVTHAVQVASTINAAASVGKSASLGSIEVGKNADLLILNADSWQHLIYQVMYIHLHFLYSSNDNIYVIKSNHLTTYCHSTYFKNHNFTSFLSYWQFGGENQVIRHVIKNGKILTDDRWGWNVTLIGRMSTTRPCLSINHVLLWRKLSRIERCFIFSCNL